MKIWKYFLMILFLISFVDCKTSPKVDMKQKEDLIKERLKSGPIMPEPDLTINWQLDGQILKYSKDNLFEYIDGEAELFFPYGFQKLLVGNYVYRLDPKQTITVDIYEMGSGLDAFGVYSKFRTPYLNFANFGCEGFIDENILRFYKDKYFVNITAVADAMLVPKNISMAGRIIDELIPGEKTHPNELKLVQTDSLISKTETYDVEGFLGYKFFHNTISAKFKYPDEEIRGFVIIRESNDNAGVTLKDYKDFLVKETKITEPFQVFDDIIIVLDDIINVKDPNYGDLLICKKGKFIVGTLGFQNKKNGEDLVKKLFGNIMIN